MRINKLFVLLATLALCACVGPRVVHDAGWDAEFEADGGKEPTDGDYWALRYGYPTMNMDSRWMREAKVQHDRIPEARPAGVAQALQHWQEGGETPQGFNLTPDQFTALGPNPLDGGFSHAAGRVNTIISHPGDPTIAYLGSDGGGVWKTTNCCDSGTTWHSLTDDPLFNSIAIGDLYFDPNDADIVYAGTGDLRYGSYSFGSAGLLRTKDAGATWEILGEDVFNPAYGQPPGVFPQYQAIGKVRVDPNDSETIVVGTKTGIFISYDDGANWDGPCLTNSFTTQRQDTTALELRDLGETTGIIAGVGTRGAPTAVQPDLSENGANGVYKATLPASGCPTDWTLVSTAPGWPTGTGGGTPYPTNIVGRIELAVAPSNPDVIYAEAIHADTLSVLGVWRSTDGGDTWVQQATPGDFGGCSGPGGQGWYDAGMTVDPNDPDVVFLSDIDVHRSDNGADSFTNITCGYSLGMPSGDDVHVDQHARTFVNGDSSRLLIGNDGGIYYTGNADAANPRDLVFTQLNDTLNTIEFYSGDITASFNTAANPGAVGGAQDNGSSVAVWAGTPSAAMWDEVWGGDGIFARIEPINEQRWYVESQRGNLGISQNGPFGPYGGVAEPWNGDSRVPFIFPFEISKHDCAETGCDQLIAGTYRVWETSTGGLNGASWYVNSPDLTKGVLADRSIINQLAFSITDSSIAIIGTNDGNVQYGFDLGQGVADSATWVNVTGGNAVLPNRPILDVFTDPAVPTTGYAAVGGFDQNTPGTPGHVFRVVCNSDCSSFEWQNKSGNLPNVPVDSIAVNPRNPSQVFAGTDWGLYFTDDIDEVSPTWMRFNAGLPSVMIWDMAIDRGFTTLALFTRSRGAYVWPLPAAPLNYSSGFE